MLSDPSCVGRGPCSDPRAASYDRPSGFCDIVLPSPSAGDGNWSWQRNRTAEPLRWTQDADDRPCDSQDPNHPDSYLLASLLGKSVVFLGDSNTRYQYLALAYFLQHGQWPKEHAYRFNILAEMSVFADPSFKNPQSPSYQGNVTGLKPYSEPWMNWKWHAFQNLSNLELQGHEACECDRNGANSNIENRFYHTSDLSQHGTRWRGSAATIRASFSWFTRLVNSTAAHVSMTGPWQSEWEPQKRTTDTEEAL